jgi:RNA polymerase nonessential primary-like sigma factor
MNHGRTVRLPVHVIKELSGYLRQSKKLAAELEKEPSIEQLSGVVKKSVKRIQQTLNFRKGALSMHVTTMPDSEQTLIDSLPDQDNIDPAALLDKLDMHDQMSAWLTSLPDLHREVIQRRFGLEGHEKQTLEVVGLEVSLTRERVRQIQIKAIKLLRENINPEHLGS